MPSQSGSSKRRQSDGKKLSRARCRARAKQRHEDNGRTQAKAHQLNLQLIKDHEPTPWQLACTEREQRRLVTCGKCRVLFDDGSCPRCGGTANLKDTWQKRSGAKEVLSAA